MNTEAIRSTYNYHSIKEAVKVKHEEEHICWLWVFPELLLWDSPEHFRKLKWRSILFLENNYLSLIKLSLCQLIEK